LDLIGKIERLKGDIDLASEYSDLEKCVSKLFKLKEKASAIGEKKKRKEIKEMIEVAEGLIHLKTKKFKKRVIEQIARGST
jgi:hypothetical protein